jgi:hypothetical protein
VREWWGGAATSNQQQQQRSSSAAPQRTKPAPQFPSPCPLSGRNIAFIIIISPESLAGIVVEKEKWLLSRCSAMSPLLPGSVGRQEEPSAGIDFSYNQY